MYCVISDNDIFNFSFHFNMINTQHISMLSRGCIYGTLFNNTNHTENFIADLFWYITTHDSKHAISHTDFLWSKIS